MAKSVGKITQVLGAIVDVKFDGDLPAILSALETEQQRQDADLGSRAAHWAKTPCVPSPWTATDGLVRGAKSTTRVTRSACRWDLKRSAVS
jgi:F-type H+-transporting ATPase subunit beta